MQIATAVRTITRRWPERRAVRTGAYYVGEVLGRQDRVLIGRVATGSVIALSSRDRQHRHIYFYEDYEPEVLAVLRQLVRRGSTFYDVGANAGYFTLAASDLGAEVHAFEPNPDVRALLERSATMNGASARINSAACSDTMGMMALYLQDSTNTGMASLEKPTDQRVDVPVTTIAAYAALSGAIPDVIKIDVEGHEHQVIAGALPLLETESPALIVETTEQRTVDLLTSRGYVAEAITPNGPRPMEFVDFGSGYANVLFRRKKM